MDTFEKSKKAIGNYPHNNIIYVPLKNMVPEEGLTWIEWSNVVLNSIENYEVEGLSKYSLYRSPIPKVIHLLNSIRLFREVIIKCKCFLKLLY